MANNKMYSLYDKMYDAWEDFRAAFTTLRKLGMKEQIESEIYSFYETADSIRSLEKDLDDLWVGIDNVLREEDE